MSRAYAVTVLNRLIRLPCAPRFLPSPTHTVTLTPSPPLRDSDGALTVARIGIGALLTTLRPYLAFAITRIGMMVDQ